MEQDEIGHRPIEDAIDRVSDGSADNQAQRKGGKPQFRAGKPDPEDQDRSRFQREKHIAAEIAVLRKQAVTDADNMIGALVVPPIGNGYLQPAQTGDLTETLTEYNEGTIGPGHCND